MRPERRRLVRIGAALTFAACTGWLLYWFSSHRLEHVEKVGAVFATCLAVAAFVTLTPDDLRKRLAVPVAAFVAAAGIVPLLLPPDQRCTELAITPELEGDPRSAGVGVTVDSMSYDLRTGRALRIAIAGHLDGDIDPTEGLYLFRNEAPGTQTSTDPPYPGRENFYISPELTPDHHGCFGHRLRELAYRCISGLTFRFHVALVDRATVRQLDAERNNVDGFPRDRILDDPGVTFLGSFEVPTEPIDDCA
jgi:hypothetical protein